MYIQLCLQVNFLSSAETVVQKCSVKKVFLEILQNAQGKHLCQSLFLIKLKVWGTGDEHLWTTASQAVILKKIYFE